MSDARHLLVVSHAPTPNTRALTDAVVRGARHADIVGIDTRIVPPLRADVADVLWAHAVILGTTANFGYMSGALKDFFDRVYDPCLDHTDRLPYAVFVRGKTDPTGALASVERIVGGLRWRRVQAPVLLVGPLEPSHALQCEELGMTMAAGLEAGLFGG